jgi:DNA-binding NarL/FixJ family response regulator
MRAILVGPAGDRARLRAGLNGVMEIVGECETLVEARTLGSQADVLLMAPEARPSRTAAGTGPAQPVESLTPREIQVLELLAEGLSNKGIASSLQISDQTVKFHVASIAGKLGAVNRTDAVRRAVRHGLISL